MLVVVSGTAPWLPSLMSVYAASWSKFHSNHSSTLFTPPDFPICQLTSKYTVCTAFQPNQDGFIHNGICSESGCVEKNSIKDRLTYSLGWQASSLDARRDHSSFHPHTMAKQTDNLPFCITRIFNHYSALLLGPCLGGGYSNCDLGCLPPSILPPYHIWSCPNFPFFSRKIHPLEFGKTWSCLILSRFSKFIPENPQPPIFRD